MNLVRGSAGVVIGTMKLPTEAVKLFVASIELSIEPVKLARGPMPLAIEPVMLVIEPMKSFSESVVSSIEPEETLIGSIGSSIHPRKSTTGSAKSIIESMTRLTRSITSFGGQMMSTIGAITRRIDRIARFIEPIGGSVPARERGVTSTRGGLAHSEERVHMKIESTRRARRLRASLFVAAAGVAAAGGAGSLAACFSSSDHGPPTSNVSGQDATAEAACTQFSANGLPLCDASLDATTGSEASADAAGPDAGDAGTTPGDAGTTPDDARTAPDAPAVVIGPLCGCGSSACDTRNGLFKCWGLNTDGQLGQGTSDNGNHPTPLLVQGISPSSCDLGRGHVCAVVDGGVQCWGENQHSQLGHDPALDDAGLVCQDPPPCNSSPTAVGLAGVTSVQVGDRHSCALAPEAGVYCWGQDQYGQAGVSGASLVNGVVAVPVPALVPVGDGGTVVEIAAGGTTSCARKMDGTVWCWGDNSSGSLGLGVAPDAATYDSNEHATPVQLSGITGAIGIAVGHRHACAILTGGQVTCWGSNDQGQLGHDPGLDPSCGGTACRTTPTTVAGLTGVSELSLGWSHTCAVTSAGTVWCWGDNSYGQLGHDPALDADGSQSFNPTPMPVTGLSSALHVAAHDLATCAVQQDSTVVCWGANFGGESGYASDAGPSSGLLNVVKGL